MKQITIAGNIGKNAETRSTGENRVTGWTVAVEDRKGREKTTIWFDCAMWGSRGEALAQYLTKGSKVVVSGDLSKREHDGKTYLTIRADQVTLMGGNQERPINDRAMQAPPSQGNAMDHEEIPFFMEWR